MSDVIMVGGGFNGAGLAGASDSLRARVAVADARHQWEAAAAERDAEATRVDRRADEVSGAFTGAVERGELSVRRAAQLADAVLAGRNVDLPPGVGFTRAEFVEHASALQDVEDARDAARQKAAYNRWLAEQSTDTSANTSAPTADELDAAALVTSRAEAYRAKRREHGRLLGQARVLAALDRGAR